MALAIVLNLATHPPPGKDNNTPVETQGESDNFYGGVGDGVARWNKFETKGTSNTVGRVRSGPFTTM